MVAVVLFMMLLLPCTVYADNQMTWEAYLQELYENNEEGAVAYETAYEHLTELQAEPLDVNTAEVEELLQIPGLDLDIINDIIEYREKYGRMKTLTELVLIPSIDNRLRDYLSCFLFVAEIERKPWYSKEELKKSLRYLKQTILMTASIPTYYRAGDIAMQSVDNNKYAGAYLGDPIKHSLRYNMKLGSHAALNFSGGKTAGEPFGCNGNGMGYDTYSFNVSANKIGCVNRVIAGHFRGQFGMGLTLNTNFIMGKQSMLSSIGRLTNAFTPHSSVSDSKHFQGVATSVDLSKRMQLSAFVSYRYVDATLNKDSVSVSTILYSPQHRTRIEMGKKNNTSQADLGLHIRYVSPVASSVKWTIGASFVYTSFNREINPTYSTADTVSSSRLYRLYNPHGSCFYNASIDYSMRWRSITLCGETAMNDCGALATLNTALWQASQSLTLSVAQRYYAYQYYTINGASFGSSSSIQNESGVYLAARYTPLSHITIEAYTDIAYYPWLKYRVSGSSYSWDNSIVTTYSNDMWSVALRYRANSRQRDISIDGSKRLAWHTDQRLRITVTRQTDQLMLRVQIEGCRLTFDSSSMGIIASGQASCSIVPKWNVYAMGAYFHTDDYESRLYAYERNTLSTLAYSAYYGQGVRLAMMLRADFSEHIMAIAKIGHTRYFDRDAIGTAERTIYSNHQTDFNLQLRLKF